MQIYFHFKMKKLKLRVAEEITTGYIVPPKAQSQDLNLACLMHYCSIPEAAQVWEGVVLEDRNHPLMLSPRLGGKAYSLT